MKKLVKYATPIFLSLATLIACNTTLPDSNNNSVKPTVSQTSLNLAWIAGQNSLLQAPWSNYGIESFSWKADESEVSVGSYEYLYGISLFPPKVKSEVLAANYSRLNVIWSKTGTGFAMFTDYALTVNGTEIPNAVDYQYGTRLIDWGFDTQRLVFTKSAYLQGDEILIANLADQSTISLQVANQNIRVLDWSDGDNKILAITDTATIYNADTRTVIWADTNTQPISGALSPTGDRVAIAYQDSLNSRITIYNANSGAVIRNITTQFPPQTLAWNPSGTQIGGGALDGISRIWNVNTGAVVKSMNREFQSISNLKWSPSGAKISVTAGLDLIFYDARTFRDLGRIGASQPSGRKNNVYGLAFSTDAPTLVEVGRNNSENLLYDSNSGITQRKFSGHSDSVYAVTYNPNGSKFITGSSDGTAIIWDSTTDPPTPINTLNSHSYTVRGVAWGANTIATASWDSTAKLWNPDTSEEIATIQHTDFVNAVAFNPASTQVATGSSDRTLKISSSTDGTLIRSIDTPAAILSLAWNSSGTQIAIGATDKNVYVYDSTTGALLKTLTGHIGAVRAVLWNKDDTAIISGGDDGNVKLWDVQTNTELTSVKPSDKFAVFALALSPNGTTVVAGTANGVTVAYNLQ